MAKGAKRLNSALKASVDYLAKGLFGYHWYSSRYNGVDKYTIRFLFDLDFQKLTTQVFKSNKVIQLNNFNEVVLILRNKYETNINTMADVP